ncbi:hypothetical protein EVAR_43547_1 [Eumeta japonica]|uniref:Uncharacterized protein n=1 Tax=Eumeta variegata TaxID=151549 RepID=A0A4C1W8Y8_EUMVA|nr:hypothetical protein EVAR_43547_1 [Eumeta japonica]
MLRAEVALVIEHCAFINRRLRIKASVYHSYKAKKKDPKTTTDRSSESCTLLTTVAAVAVATSVTGSLTCFPRRGANVSIGLKLKTLWSIFP